MTNVPVKDRMHFEHLPILIAAYISYMYEKDTSANIEALEDDKLRNTLMKKRTKVKKSDSSDSESESEEENGQDGDQSHAQDEQSFLEMIKSGTVSTCKWLYTESKSLLGKYVNFMGKEKASFI